MKLSTVAFFAVAAVLACAAIGASAPVDAARASSMIPATVVAAGVAVVFAFGASADTPERVVVATLPAEERGAPPGPAGLDHHRGEVAIEVSATEIRDRSKGVLEKRAVP